MSDAVIDDAQASALERLTDNEKECLRRRLDHQTAKEMALDLGISPHAVEKRLKMARAKLGLSSSLDAARILAEWERYGHSGSQTPDLAIPVFRAKAWFTRPIAIGAIAMSLIAASLIVIAQQGGVAPLDAGGVAPLEQGGVALTPRPGELLLVAPQAFEALDKDHSGYLEGDEAPALVRAGGSPVYKTDEAGNNVLTSDYLEVSRTRLRDSFYAEADTDGDGKVSPAEYDRWSNPAFASKSASAKNAPDGQPINWVTFDESEIVEATPAEILVIVQNTFHVVDKDRSGFIDGEESAMHAPEGGSPVYRRDENGKAVPTGEVRVMTEEQARADFYRQADYDGDGKVTFAEYRRWMSPNLVRNGIPAAWKADMNKPIPSDPG